MTEEQLFAEWARELSIQNSELTEEGEEPLTAEEFFQCRAEDALARRETREQERIERWHATYNAAITGLRAFGGSDTEWYEVAGAHSEATKQADIAHGPLKAKP